MRIVLLTSLLLALAGIFGPPLLAQDTQPSGDRDSSSQSVEESDEAYRRRMELEDARNRDPTYTDPPDDYRRDLEKIDKLPKESRENIRDQLVDIIVENPEWEPGDALEEYPYEPSTAAEADAGLMQQEQEAWDEQIEKYHAREAAAYGAYRGPVSGPGNPGGQEGSTGEEGSEGSQQDSGQGESQQGSQGAGSGSSNGSAGTYQPYESQTEQSDDTTSTRGVSESALDFLLKQQPNAGQGSDASQAQRQAAESQAEQDARQQTAQQPSDPQPDPDSSENPDMRGILAIEDLDKMTGAGGVAAPADQNDEDPDEEVGEEEGEEDSGDTGGG